MVGGIRLYSYWRSSAAYRVRIALNLKGLNYEIEPVHLVRDGGEQHSPEYRRVNPQELIPTLVVGYEYALTPNTNLNIQGYASTSVYSRHDTSLDELLEEKYQLTAGFRHRRNNVVVSFGVTENVQNINNTPDIGLQFGLSWFPGR